MATDLSHDKLKTAVGGLIGFALLYLLFQIIRYFVNK